MTGAVPAPVADLAHDPAAQRARKRPVALHIEFARAAGTLATREGPVTYATGDALVTAEDGNRWPVAAAQVVRIYVPVPPTVAGSDGTYRKLAHDVLAKRMDAPFTVTLPAGRGTLHGEAGDWLVQYAPGDQAVVGDAIFARTYELAE